MKFPEQELAEELKRMLDEGDPSVCRCTSSECDLIHNTIELEDAIEEELSQDEEIEVIIPNPTCPQCKTEKDTFGYEYQTVIEGGCRECSINFVIATNEIVKISFYDPTKIAKFVTTKLKHETFWDKNQWACTGCKLTFHDTTKAKSHEKELSGGHNMSYTTLGDTRWICDHCEYKCDLWEDMKVHEDTGAKPVPQEPHYTSFVSQNKWKCEYCPEVFATLKLANEHDNEAGRKKKNPGSYSGTTYTPHDIHKPFHAMDLGEGAGVWVGRKTDCTDTANDYDIILNLTGARIYRKHDIPFPELKQWETGGAQEIVLDWPDFGVLTTLPKEFWIQLLTMVKAKKAKLLTFCVGGHGRTGTALASMLVTEFNYGAQQAIDWVKTTYCSKAIEAVSQEKYIYTMAGEKFIPPPVSETKTLGKGNGQTTLIGGW